MLQDDFDSRALLDEINDLVQSVAADGRFLYVNRAWRETLGYTDAEIAGLNVFQIIHPKSLAHCTEMFRRVTGGENLSEVEADFVAKNGEIISVEGSVMSSFRNGEMDATRSIFRNVTNRKNAEKALREREDLFGAFMNNSPVVAFMKDERGRYVYANKVLEQMFEMKVSALIGLNDFEWLPAQIAESVWTKDQFVLSSQQKIESLEIVPTPDGAAKYWTVYKFPFTDTDGKKYVGGAAVNVTAQKEIEIELQRKQREIETLVEHSSDVIVRLDQNLRFVYVNAAIEKLVNSEKQNFIGKTFAEAGLSDESFRAAEYEMRSVFTEARESLFEMQFPFAAGWRYFQVRVTPEFSSEGGDERVESILIVARDTTERKEMEESVRRSERHYRNLVEGGQGFLFTHNRVGTILSINPAAAQSLGYAISEIIGKNLRDFMREQRFNELETYLKRVWLDKSADGVISILNRDGLERFWKYHNVKLTETVEEPFVLGYAQDITEIKETEKQLKNLSLSDDLTGLYNRRGFLMLAERQLQIVRAAQKEKGVFLVFADMDGLKQINDTFGHDQGSLAIRKISEILASNFRGSDVVARLGGDEFVVLVVDERDETQELVVNRLQKKIAHYNAQKNHEFDLSLSVGITPVILQNPVAIESLLQEADQAMYVQKRMKKGLI